MKIRLFISVVCLFLVYCSYLQPAKIKTAEGKQFCTIAVDRESRDQDIVKILDALAVDQIDSYVDGSEVCVAAVQTKIGLAQVRYQPTDQRFSIIIGKKVFADNGLDGTLDEILEDSKRSDNDFLTDVSEYTNAKVEVMKAIGVYVRPIGQSE